MIRTTLIAFIALTPSVAFPSSLGLNLKVRSVLSVRTDCTQAQCSSSVFRLRLKSLTREHKQTGLTEVLLRESIVQLRAPAFCARTLELGLTHPHLLFEVRLQDQPLRSLEPEPLLNLDQGHCEASLETSESS